MKKPKPEKESLRAEYDLRTLGNGVTGKYFQRATAGANLVLLDPDVAKVFPDAESVNRALRLLMEVAAAGNPVAQRKKPRTARPRQSGVPAKSAVSSRVVKSKGGTKRA